MVFWVGLIITALAGLELFGVLWLIMVVSYWERPTAIEFWIRSPIIPAIVAGVVFMIIGIVMMLSGKNKNNKISNTST